MYKQDGTKKGHDFINASFEASVEYVVTMLKDLNTATTLKNQLWAECMPAIRTFQEVIVEQGALVLETSKVRVNWKRVI